MNEEEKPRLRFAHAGIEPPVEQGEQPVSLIAVHRSACQRDDCEIPKSFWNPRGVQYRSARYVFLVARCGWGVAVFDSVGRYTAGLFGDFLGEALVPTNVARQILAEQRSKRHTRKAKRFDAEDILSQSDPVWIDVQSEYGRCFLRRELVHNPDAGL
jgi:hypothetical protein